MRRLYESLAARHFCTEHNNELRDLIAKILLQSYSFLKIGQINDAFFE